MLLEPGGSDLAPDLLLSPSLVTVVNGVTYVPVVNVGATGATVHAKQVLGKLHQVEGIEGQQLYCVGEGEEVAHVTVVNVHTVMGSPMPISETISALQWPGLTSAEGRQVKELLEEYHQFFPKSEGDLGCTHETEHEIPLTDNIPVHQIKEKTPYTVAGCEKIQLSNFWTVR